MSPVAGCPGAGGAGGNGANEGEAPAGADPGEAPMAVDAGAEPAAGEGGAPEAADARAALGDATPLDFGRALASLARCASLALSTSNSSSHQ